MCWSAIVWQCSVEVLNVRRPTVTEIEWLLNAWQVRIVDKVQWPMGVTNTQLTQTICCFTLDSLVAYSVIKRTYCEFLNKNI